MHERSSTGVGHRDAGPVRPRPCGRGRPAGSADASMPAEHKESRRGSVAWAMTTCWRRSSSTTSWRPRRCTRATNRPAGPAPQPGLQDRPTDAFLPDPAGLARPARDAYRGQRTCVVAKGYPRSRGSWPGPVPTCTSTNTSKAQVSATSPRCPRISSTGSLPPSGEFTPATSFTWTSTSRAISSSIVTAARTSSIFNFPCTSATGPCSPRRLSRRLRLWLQSYDIYHVCKHKRRLQPDLLTPTEEQLSRNHSLPLRIHRAIAKPYKRIRRACLRYLHAKGILIPPERPETCPETDPARWAKN